MTKLTIGKMEIRDAIPAAIKIDPGEGVKMVIRFGYARVSTSDQDCSIQVAKLRDAGCHMIREEKVSGKSREGRDELQLLIDFLQPGNELVVTKLDRLGRSTRDVLNICHELEQKGCCLRVLDQNISTADPQGKILMMVFGLVAEMEREIMLDRQVAGIIKAKAEGRYTGAKKRFSRGDVLRAQENGMNVAQIAKQLGCSRATVYRLVPTGWEGQPAHLQAAGARRKLMAASRRAGKAAFEAVLAGKA